VLSIGAFFNGDAITERAMNGEEIVDSSFFFAINSYWEPVGFTLPPGFGDGWEVVVDTSSTNVATTGRLKGGDPLHVGARTMVVLRRPTSVERA
jgi:glycogen operon protein